MRKISLISAAVLAAFSMSAVAKDANTDDVAQPVTLKPGDAVYETITIGNAKDNVSKHFLSISQGTDASISNVIMKGTFVDGENKKPGSYIKTWGNSLEIGSLSLQAGTQENMGQGIIEFWGDKGATQSVKVGTLSIGANAVLRIQESSLLKTPITSVNVSEVNLGSNSALAFGSVDKYGTETASIDSLNAVDGGVSAVANVSLSDTRVQLGEINVKDTVLTFSGSKDDLPEGTTLPIDVPLESVAVEGQTSNGGNIAVNMLGTDSKLIFADVGSNEAENQTTLNVNFSQETFNSDTSIVTFTKDASVAEGTILNLSAENVAKETNAENVDVLNALAQKVDTTGGQKFADTSLTATSDVYDTVTAKTGADGTVDTSTMKTYENAEVFSFAQLHSVGVMQWREEMNHMQLRLGEIRDAAGHNNGAWARIYNGKDEYGSQDVENKYYGMQIGFDHRLENSNWIIGGAFSYARGDSTFSTGEGDNHNFAFTGYGTWLGENGLFVDVTGKVGRLSNDITIDHYTSDYDTNAVSVTAEAGWRFTLNDMFYVEPQAEMMYGHIMGASYKTLNYKADTEDVDMWVGRLGFQTGLTCPAKKGGIYFRASVLHDFDGDAETKFTGLKSGNTRTLLDELGGTWYEMGLGANYNVTDSTYVYADFQYANGGEIDTPWRWNLGVRYSF